MAADGGGDKEAVCFLHQHPFASSHVGPSQCSEAGQEAHFLTVAQSFVYLKAMHASEMANGNHLYFSGVAAGTLVTAPTGEVGNMSAQMSGHADFDASSWDAARGENMLVALRAKFNTYPELAEQLLESAGRSLAQASQGGCDHGISLGVIDATLGMAWRGENFFGNCLELLREKLLGARTKGIANGKRGRGQNSGRQRWGEGGQGGQQKRQRNGKRGGAVKAKTTPQPKRGQGGGANGEVALAGCDVEVGGTAPAGAKCNVCQKGALRDRGIITCGGCSKWVQAFKVCGKRAQ